MPPLRPSLFWRESNPSCKPLQTVGKAFLRPGASAARPAATRQRSSSPRHLHLIGHSGALMSFRPAAKYFFLILGILPLPLIILVLISGPASAQTGTGTLRGQVT